ncbi:hypothetical protein LDENG_00202830 [Lucifuga dentata]|nr:hypothetical protein LDENG_00202830 [Lucifuga dentata]
MPQSHGDATKPTQTELSSSSDLNQVLLVRHCLPPSFCSLFRMIRSKAHREISNRPHWKTWVRMTMWSSDLCKECFYKDHELWI